jgi:hypothetical protein
MQMSMMMLQKYQFELRDCSHILLCHADHIVATGECCLLTVATETVSRSNERHDVGAHCY